MRALMIAGVLALGITSNALALDMPGVVQGVVVAGSEVDGVPAYHGNLLIRRNDGTFAVVSLLKTTSPGYSGAAPISEARARWIMEICAESAGAPGLGVKFEHTYPGTTWWVGFGEASIFSFWHQD